MTSLLLQLTNVSLNIAGVETPILHNINYHVYAGDFVIVLGSNGSGKSTLLKLIDQRLKASHGRIVLDNQLLADYPAKRFSQTVKTLTQNCHDSLFTSLTLLENYRLMKQQPSGKQDREFFADYLQDFNPHLSLKLDQAVDSLSGGEKQALALALIMLNPPRLLLLDEHTSALDPKSAAKLMALTARIVEEHHVTCLLTTHDLSIAEEYGNRMMALKQGELTQVIEYSEKKAMDRNHLLSVCY